MRRLVCAKVLTSRRTERAHTVNQSFLLGTTAYVVIPSLMVFGVLVLRPRVNRIANIALGLVYALSIVAIAYYAWTWPRAASPSP